MLTHCGDRTGRKITIKVEKMLPQVFETATLSHIVRVKVEVAKPHVAVLPEGKTYGAHRRKT
jgi:hypothetical protein